MGWLEVLAQLKRILPLLSRLAPMLETFIATRGGARAGNDAALEQVAGDIKGQLAVSAEKHDGIAALLQDQAKQITALTSQVGQMRHENDRASARLLEIETALAAVARSLRKIGIAVIILLVLCLGLLGALLLHFR